MSPRKELFYLHVPYAKTSLRAGKINREKLLFLTFEAIQEGGINNVW
jgi:hypothetical protein